MALTPRDEELVASSRSGGVEMTPRNGFNWSRRLTLVLVPPTDSESVKRSQKKGVSSDDNKPRHCK